eukprot:EG_transcript_5104
MHVPSPPVAAPPQWPTKGAFVLVAVGASLGSFFRLPWVAYHYGGADLLYPYLICVLLLAAPTLLLELALGQIYQGGLLQAIQKVHPWFRGLGYYVLLLALVVSAYTVAWSSWAVFYLTDSWPSQLPLEVRLAYFPGLVPEGQTNPAMESYNWWLLVAMAVQWASVCVSLCWGVHMLPYVAYVAVPLVGCILGGLVVWAFFVDGALSGVAYLFVPHPQRWNSPQLWMAAMVQSLLSLGLGTGVMPALGARNYKSRDVWKWSLVVALGCAAGSVLAAVLAFALLGSAGQLQDPPPTTPPNLALALSALLQLFAGLPSIATACLRPFVYLPVYSLGIIAAWAPALSLMQVVAVHFPNVPDTMASVMVCLAGLLFSVPFALGAGYRLLQAMTYYVPNFCVTAVVLLECVAVGYFGDSTSLRQRVRERGHDGWRRARDYASVGCYYSVGVMQQRLNEMSKTHVSRPLWCTLIKYVVPCAVLVLPVTEAAYRIVGHPGLLLGQQAVLSPAMAGWLLLLLLPLTLTLAVFLLPRGPVEEDGLWNRAADLDSPAATPFELGGPNGL